MFLRLFIGRRTPFKIVFKIKKLREQISRVFMETNIDKEEKTIWEKLVTDDEK